MNLKVKECEQLNYEIQGKFIVIKDGEKRKVEKEMDGILKSEEFNQKEKLELRKLSKKIEKHLELVKEQEKSIYEEVVDNYGTPEAKYKALVLPEGKTEETRSAEELAAIEKEEEKKLDKKLKELYETTFEVHKTSIPKERFENITGTSDFYEFLIELHSN